MVSWERGITGFEASKRKKFLTWRYVTSGTKYKFKKLKTDDEYDIPDDAQTLGIGISGKVGLGKEKTEAGDT